MAWFFAKNIKTATKRKKTKNKKGKKGQRRPKSQKKAKQDQGVSKSKRCAMCDVCVFEARRQQKKSWFKRRKQQRGGRRWWAGRAGVCVCVCTKGVAKVQGLRPRTRTHHTRTHHTRNLTRNLTLTQRFSVAQSWNG